MKKKIQNLGFFLITGLLACVSSQHRQTMTDPLIGELSRQQIEQHFIDFKPQKYEEHTIKLENSQALSEVLPGAEVTVYLGTWCGDSKRELRRIWQVLDIPGTTPPFSIRYIGVDRQKKAPQVTKELNLRFVPTFVVSRNGLEIGRVVESAPQGIEVELKRLLSGETQGLISGRSDL